MEITFLKALINSISQFSSSCNGVRSDLIKKYCQNIDDALIQLRSMLDEILGSEIALEERLIKAFEELDAFVNEVREIIEGWQQMSSKLCFVLQIDSLIQKIRTSGLEICRLLDSLFQSFTSDSLYFQQCFGKLKLLGSSQASDFVREAVRCMHENTTPNSESLLKIANSLNLVSNQELLLEAVALEKVKKRVDRDNIDGVTDHIDHMIALITLMHNDVVTKQQCHAINGIPIPTDFCCPLSLELMSDPVIVSSGQTYERAYISRWLEQGLNICPKTHQTLSRTNLIPNYTVKALIASWCELNDIELPDPLKSARLNEFPLTSVADSRGSPCSGSAPRVNGVRSPEYILNSQLTVSSSGIQDNPTLNSYSISSSEHIPHLDTGDGIGMDVSRASPDIFNDDGSASDDLTTFADGQSLVSSREDLSMETAVDRFHGHNQTSSISSAMGNSDRQQAAEDAAEESHSGEFIRYSSDASGELTSEASASAPIHGEPEVPQLVEARPRNQIIWRRPSERYVSRIVSSQASDSRPDLSGIETQVKKLIEDLQSNSDDLQRAAAAEIRLLAKHNMDNRIVIASCGAIPHLVQLLRSNDPRTQENAVTALLNLSINDNNKTAIANAGAIEPLIHVLQIGSAEAKENSAATLFSLSVIEENKAKIGQSGAIRPLVELLANGTPRGKKDAATALFNLSIFSENKRRIVQAGAVKYLLELMEPAAGMVDKAVAVLSNLSTISEGQSAIGQAGGIRVLVEVVELGSARGKENAAAALLQLCTNNNRFCNMVLQEGAVPPLVALSQSGTPRAKEKAQTLLSYFRSQRQGNAGRG